MGMEAMLRAVWAHPAWAGCGDRRLITTRERAAVAERRADERRRTCRLRNAVAGSVRWAVVR